MGERSKSSSRSTVEDYAFQDQSLVAFQDLVLCFMIYRL